MNRVKSFLTFAALFLLTAPLSLAQAESQASVCEWPEFNIENMPGSRWWWLGSAVDKDNLTWNMEQLRNVGIGSLEITPIYGVQGEEARDIDYLSPKWMDMYAHVLKESSRLGMYIDMNGGTGWPFGGGEDMSPEYAASKQFVQTYELSPEYVNPKARVKKFKAQTLSVEVLDPRQKGVSSLQALMFVGEDGSRVRLPLPESDELVFAPEQKGRLLALYCGKTNQKVKRAAPGGEGLVMNHLEKSSLEHYLSRFDRAFGESGAQWPHTIFNDSYEVYGADWSENLLEEFKERRGYDLADYLPEFMGDGDKETAQRVICDYRRTLAEMLLDNFTRPWAAWSHEHGMSVRNQAHGSPGNLLDLYGAVDIPECESFGCTQFDIPRLRVDSDIRRNDANPATLRYASSAAHVMGKNLTSSESMTWLTEHFRTSLALIKPEMDQLFANGVNRVFYHGSPYTPKEAAWPGWLFYASILVNPNNTIFRDMDALNLYITRVQSFMQRGKPDNELLLYFPIYDIWENYFAGSDLKNHYLAFDIHKLYEKLPSFDKTIYDILSAGYDFDYISDDQLAATGCLKNGTLQTPGKNIYQAILVPSCEVMPLETLRQILNLASKGSCVMFLGCLPSDVPGLMEKNEKGPQLKSLVDGLGLTSEKMKDALLSVTYGNGQLLASDDLNMLLSASRLTREPMSDFGLEWARRSDEQGHVYFLSMTTDRTVDGWVGLGHSADNVLAFDPLTGDVSLAPIRQERGETQVYLQIQPGESLILRTLENGAGSSVDAVSADKLETKWPAYAVGLPASYLKKHPNAEHVALEGKWNFHFTDGAPAIEGDFIMEGKPTSWTELPSEQAANYAGSGVYTLEFKMPKVKADDWVLDFGNGLYESARIRINGQDAGKVWCAPYQMNVGKYLKPGKKNQIEIEVTDMPANRIADYDRRGVDWRIFKDINVVSVFYKPITFDVWETVPGGLTESPVLIPMKRKTL